MPYAAAWASQVFRHLFRLARYEPPAWRRPLTRTYLRLRVLSLARPGFDLDRPRSVPFLDGRLWFYKYESAALLLEEVFIRRQYDVPLDREDPTIIDCGSNIGFSVLFFKARHPNARIVSFEPNPSSFALLKRNVESNGLTDVELVNQAVAAEEGLMHVHDFADEPGSMVARVVSESTGGGPEVAATKLSSWINDPVDLLKLDLEGAEPEVLEELRSEDKLGLVRQMVVEYHHHQRPGDDERFAGSLGLLEDAGFAYELLALTPLPFARDRFQNVLLYAYRP